MRHVQRITNDRRRDHLLAPSRQLAMHGIVRKLDVPRQDWGGVLYVGSPSQSRTAVITKKQQQQQQVSTISARLTS